MHVRTDWQCLGMRFASTLAELETQAVLEFAADQKQCIHFGSYVKVCMMQNEGQQLLIKRPPLLTAACSAPIACGMECIRDLGFMNRSGELMTRGSLDCKILEWLSMQSANIRTALLWCPGQKGGVKTADGALAENPLQLPACAAVMSYKA